MADLSETITAWRKALDSSPEPIIALDVHDVRAVLDALDPPNPARPRRTAGPGSPWRSDPREAISVAHGAAPCPSSFGCVLHEGHAGAHALRSVVDQ